jgi:hypothetical protein
VATVWVVCTGDGVLRGVYADAEVAERDAEALREQEAAQNGWDAVGWVEASPREVLTAPHYATAEPVPPGDEAAVVRHLSLVVNRTA